MNFGKIMEWLAFDFNIKRPHWEGHWTVGEGESIPLSLNGFTISRVGDAPGTLYSDDILAEDWEVVE